MKSDDFQKLNLNIVVNTFSDINGNFLIYGF